MRFHNRTVWITEGGHELGLALMRALAAEGASLLVSCRAEGLSLVEEAGEALRAQGVKVKLAAGADLCRRSELEALLDEAEEELGPVQSMVHSNLLSISASVEACSEMTFLQVLNENAKTAFFCTQAVGRRMSERQSGAIVYAGSIHAEKPTGSAFAFSAARGAVKMLSKEAALVLGRQGVRVNTVELGPMEGDDQRFASAYSPLYDQMERKVPRARLGAWTDAAAAVLWLISPEADYVNGADLRVDGGFLLHYMDHKMKKQEEASPNP